MTKFIIIGCGYVSSLYMDSHYFYKKKFKLIGCFDIDEDKSEKFSKKYNCKKIAKLNLCANHNVDLIVNLSSMDAHFKINKFFLSKGINVYSEKLPCLFINQLNILYNIADKMRVRFSFAPCNHLNWQNEYLKKIIKSKKYGNLNFVEMNYCPGLLIYNKPWEWKNKIGFNWPAKQEFKVGTYNLHSLYLIKSLMTILGDSKFKKIKKISYTILRDKKIIKNNIDDFHISFFKIGAVPIKLNINFFYNRDMSLNLFFDEHHISINNIRNEKNSIYIFSYKSPIYKLCNYLNNSLGDLILKLFSNKIYYPSIKKNFKTKNVDYFKGIEKLIASNNYEYNLTKKFDINSFKNFLYLK